MDDDATIMIIDLDWALDEVKRLDRELKARDWEIGCLRANLEHAEAEVDRVRAESSVVPETTGTWTIEDTHLEWLQNFAATGEVVSLPGLHWGAQAALARIRRFREAVRSAQGEIASLRESLKVAEIKRPDAEFNPFTRS